MFLIETRDLSHVYMAGTPFEIKALDRINIRIRRGSFTGIIGQTGSGKSTLVQHFNMLLRPTSGCVFYDGREIRSLNARRLRQKVGLVFQYPEHQLFEETVYRDIAFGPQNLGLPEAEVKRRVHDALELIGLDAAAIAGRSPFELSGGQMRRVAIAGVMAMEPEVLVLDEPTAGLDPAGRKLLLEQLLQIHHAKALTVIMVSHNMDEVSRLADTLFVMHEGRVVLQGSPGTVFSERARLESVGLRLPVLAELMQRLKERGKPVRTDIFTVEQAREEILACLQGGGRD